LPHEKKLRSTISGSPPNDRPLPCADVVFFSILWSPVKRANQDLMAMSQQLLSGSVKKKIIGAKWNC
jgi:hypothetical protein